MPKVSIIIPNYNHEKFLDLRITSVLSQTYQDFEVIILDDASTDNSRAVIEQYRQHPKVSRIVYNMHNSGSPFSQWEQGMHLAVAEWLWIAESDDYASPDFLESLVDIASRQDDAGIAFCDSYIVDENQQRDGTEAIYNHDNIKYNNGINEVRERLSKYCSIINVSCCIIKKEHALNAIGGLGKYKACGDWIFYTRLLQHTNFTYTSKKLNYYRHHNKSVSYSAQKKHLWVTEGIDVLKNIDFKIVKFSNRQFLSLTKMWLPELTRIRPNEGFKAALTMLLVACKFYATRLQF